MAILNRRCGLWKVIARILLVAVFAGGLPPLSGVTIIGAQGPPAFTLDICHPLPGANHGFAFSVVSLTPPRLSVEKLLPCGPAQQSASPPVSRDMEPPELPPP